MARLEAWLHWGNLWAVLLHSPWAWFTGAGLEKVALCNWHASLLLHAWEEPEI